MSRTKRILVAPLNWGLGHATRCIPVIRTLLSRNCEVFLASDGPALELLEKEFPELDSFTLPAYDVHYGGKNLIMSLGLQMPKILRAIRQENREIRLIEKNLELDAIVSDNRYGCYSKRIPSVFLCHQINLFHPLQPIMRMISFAHQTWLRKFSECWIPDWEEEPNLSGKLGHQHVLKNAHYIGPLSRMETGSGEAGEMLIAILSGPEPDRSQFENQLYAQLLDCGLKTLFVRGKLKDDQYLKSAGSVRVVPFMGADALNEAIDQASVVIARSGYSTLMDLVKKAKPAILVPTPGQPEQEYLASRMEEMKIFKCQNQNELNIPEGLRQLDQYSASTFQWPETLLETKLEEWLQRI